MVETLLAEYAVEEMPIERETTFHDDLELESVDLVTLADMLMDHYGPVVNLAEFFAEKELDEVIAMTVGEVVDYVVGRLASVSSVSPVTSAAAMEG
jgi:acyl carrier protein